MVSYSKRTTYFTRDELLSLLAQKKNGKPNYGAILRYFRKVAGWSAEQLAFVYSEALGLDEDQYVTAAWIRMMETQNEVPMDEKRRWILARLLDIPPFLFGLESLERTSFDLFNWERIDVQEYRSTLEKYSTGWHATTFFQAVSDVKHRIGNLYREAPHASEKQEMLKLLCGYLILLGDLAHSFMEFDSAIDHFEKAIAVAKEEKLYDLWAFALRQKGNVYEERGEITAGTQGYSAAKADFALAKGHIQVAQALEQKIQPVFCGLVLACASTAYAACAQDQQEFNESLKILENATKSIGKTADDLSLIPARFDEERYHLDRATAYLAYPRASVRYAQLAQEELAEASRKSQGSFARKVFADTLLARSYLLGRDYNMATSYTGDALSSVIASTSNIHFARLDIVYQSLRKTSYGKSADVALLGVKLLESKKPEIFH